MSRRLAAALLAASTLLIVALLVAASAAPRTPRAADLEGTGTRLPPSRPATTASTTVPTDPSPSASVPVASPTTVLVRPALVAADPVRLAIPAIGVDAVVRRVGLAADGSMAVPPPAEVGWYGPGAAPGDEQGSAVLAGHVDFDGRRGAFFDLRALQPGTEVFVADATGQARRFRVAERYQVDKDDVPIEQIFRRTGEPALTLVTCGGAFNPTLRHYADNIVVVATPA